jgi:hypothetical protein
MRPLWTTEIRVAVDDRDPSRCGRQRSESPWTTEIRVAVDEIRVDASVDEIRVAVDEIRVDASVDEIRVAVDEIRVAGRRTFATETAVDGRCPSRPGPKALSDAGLYREVAAVLPAIWLPKGEALATAARGQQPSREPLAAASEAIAVGAFPRPCKWYRAALDDSSSDRRAAGMPHARSPVRGFVASRITPLARWHDEHWLTAVVITVLDEIRVAVDDRDPTGYPD